MSKVNNADWDIMSNVKKVEWKKCRKQEMPNGT